MLAVSTAAGALLDGQVRDAVHTRITITLPGNVYPDVTLAASAVTVSAQDTTSLPDPSHFATGMRAMTASFTLSGLVDQTDATKTAAWLFGRWSTSSPLYRSDALRALVTIDVLLYPAGASGTPVSVRKFTGYVSDYSRQGDDVQVDCVDPSVLLTPLPAIPAVATASPWNAGLTSEYAVDAVLRAASGGAISSWPKQVANCVLAVGFRTSLWPEVGTLVSASFTPQFAPGAFGSALYASTVTNAPITVYDLAGGIAQPAYFQFWVTGVGASGGTVTVQIGPQTDFVSLQVTSTGLLVQGPSLGTVMWSVPVSTGPHCIEMRLQAPPFGGTGCSGTLYLDGVAYGFAGSSSTARTVYPYTTAGYAVGVGCTLEALQIGTSYPAGASYPFTPGAVIDPSLNPLDVVPPIDAEADAYDTILTIAEAEMALAGFDESGVFRFQNRQNLAGKASSRTVTSTTALTDLTEESLDGAVINHAQVGWTNWATSSSYTPGGEWNAKGKWHIPARATGRNKQVNYVTLPDVCVGVPSAFTVLPDTGTVSDGINYFASSLDRNGVTKDPNPPTITATQVSSTIVKLVIDNNDPRDKWLVVPSTQTGPFTVGTPMLRIAGQPVTAGDEAIADYQYPAPDDGGAASSRFGDVLWQETGSAWIQDGGAAMSLAQWVVNDGYVPRPNLSVGIIADPRIQLADVIQVLDTDDTGVSEYVRVFGWDLDLSDWTQTLDARTVAAPGAAILNVTGRSELNTNTWLPGG